MKKKKQLPDLHYFYEAAVQGVENDLDFAARVFRNKRKRKPVMLREDFCGTAALACEWVNRSPKHRAWGVDIDQPTLDWGLKHNIAYLKPGAQPPELVCSDVMTAKTPPVDLIFALNFSFCIFKTRDLLRSYFEKAREALDEDGMLVLDLYGGTEAIEAKLEPREIDKHIATDGTKIPAFTYIWDQSEYNVIDHHVVNYIHFKVPGFGKIEKAFTYDWRLWTLPEIQELLLEAGFKAAEVYLHDWTDDGESDETYRRRTRYENSLGWVAYIVGIR
ncbi:MAG: class I SAM-dependent methyltransferase [Kiritimatiellales bacterium]